jgi:hypothetical protein
MTLKIEKINIEQAKRKAIKELRNVAYNISKYFLDIESVLTDAISDEDLMILGGLLIHFSQYVANDEQLSEGIKKTLISQISAISHH